MWRCGTPQNFFVEFIDELEKQLLKKLFKWTDKKWKNFNIYKIVFLKKNEEKYLEISLF